MCLFGKVTKTLQESARENKKALVRKDKKYSTHVRGHAKHRDAKAESKLCKFIKRKRRREIICSHMQT